MKSVAQGARKSEAVIDISKLTETDKSKTVLYKAYLEDRFHKAKIVEWTEDTVTIQFFTGFKKVTCYPSNLIWPEALPDKAEITLYVHGSSESAWSVGERIGLNEEALRVFSHASNEHEMTYEVDTRTGESTLIKVDGRVLLPTESQ